MSPKNGGFKLLGMKQANHRHDYQNALVRSVADPSAANVNALIELAQVDGIGVHNAARHRQGLLAWIDRPSDEQLTEAAEAEQAASDAMMQARQRLADAQFAFESAEADAVAAKQRHAEMRSDRLVADRALTDPTVAEASKLIPESKA